ncbi:hypothetical protein I4F81_008242 [Pyropia yezoensis]|uniref:Uncharacterized protein n=1 Tax=Pyropia yezoensis TaxID=2788 RepID=A0ACC3C6C8_PYRYE|nr:hypothetical protein I4F81_008242 [Neopyropia yezoensis]
MDTAELRRLVRASVAALREEGDDDTPGGRLPRQAAGARAFSRSASPAARRGLAFDEEADLADVADLRELLQVTWRSALDVLHTDVGVAAAWAPFVRVTEEEQATLLRQMVLAGASGNRRERRRALLGKAGSPRGAAAGGGEGADAGGGAVAAVGPNRRGSCAGALYKVAHKALARGKEEEVLLGQIGCYCAQ